MNANQPKLGQTVLIKWRRRSLCTDGRRTFLSDWVEFVTASSFVLRSYPIENLTWIEGCGGFFTIPDGYSGYENEFVDWVGFE